MKNEDQLGTVNQSDGPQQNLQGHDLEQPRTQHEIQERQDVEFRRNERRERRNTPWVVGMIAVVVICALFMLMGHIASTLADTKQMVANNGQTLNSMNSQLSGMQTQLTALGQQVNQLQNEIQNYFTAAMNYLSHRAH